MRTTRALVVTAALALATTVIACGDDEDSSNSSGSNDSAAQTADGSSVTYVTGFRGLDYYESIVCAATPVAEEHGFDFESQDPEKYDPSIQIPIVDAVLQRNPDALLLSPSSPTALIPPVERAKRGGAKVILIGTTLAEPVADGIVRANNEEGGRLAAEAMIEQLDGKQGSVAVISTAPGSGDDSEARARGFEEGIKAAPNIKYLGRQIVQFDSADAAQKMNALISGNDDLIGVFATFGIAAKGAASVVRTRDVGDELVLFGGDNDDPLEQLLTDGLLDGLVFDNTPEMGRQAIAMANSALTGEAFEKEVFVPAVFATAETLEDPAITDSRATQACG